MGSSNSQDNFTSTFKKPGQPLTMDSFHQNWTLACGCINIGITVVGILGNTLSIKIFASKTQKCSTNIQLVGLSTVDLLLLICFIPLLIVPEMAFATGAAPLTMDVIYYSFAYVYPCAVTFQTISILILMLITTERFMAVCFPIQAKMYWSEFLAKLTLLLTFVVGITINMIRFWEYQIRPCNGTECWFSSVVAKDLLSKNRSYIFWYKFIIPSVCALIACLFISFMNTAIAYNMWLVKRRCAHLSRNIVTEHNIAKMMITIVVVFVLCYGLHIYMYFQEVVTSMNGSTKHFTVLDDLSNMLVILNSAISCFVYCMCESYRNQVKSLLKAVWNKLGKGGSQFGSNPSTYEMISLTDNRERVTHKTSITMSVQLDTPKKSRSFKNEPPLIKKKLTQGNTKSVPFS